MKNSIVKGYQLLWLALASLATMQLSCAQTKSKGPASPPGYDLSKPQKYNMPDVLQEISGIAFNKGDNKMVYAEQDEEGKIFRLPLGTKNESATKFAGKGDYEDIAISQGWAILLKSNGHLYTFPLSETQKPEAANVQKLENMLPKGEYEGMFANQATGDLYVLCKDCKTDRGKKQASGYIFSLQKNGTVKPKGTFVVDASQIDKLSGKKKGAFHPSALAMNLQTNEWYIVSSVNKALIVTDAKWKIKNVYHLSSNIFNQPEGIAFDKDNNLYISNEGSETQQGNILRFDYKKP
ncbi:SdiA-regulated domain-containing protein [Pedobacter sp. ASV12]|uniref:SdiA-regulated domain-containing protein n=1 Tax=Pedobacter sp. ASV12 TaxID=2795120 RepID=UPI0018EA998A|nr:SdiA-regulated domain-containing protein [Pedobacter sp. ASV12]